MLLKPPPQSYDTFMDSCMKRNDLLRGKRSLRERRSEEPQGNEPVALAQLAPETSTAAPANSEPSGNVSTGAAAQSQNNTDSSPVTPSNNITVAKEENRQEAAERQAEEEKKAEVEDEVVSIMEIGYPALIEQLKARKCIELYMVYTERVAQEQQQQQQQQVGERSNGNYNDDYKAKGGGEKLGALNQGTMLLLSSTVSLLLSLLLLH